MRSDYAGAGEGRDVKGRNTNWEKRKEPESSTRRGSKSFGFLDELELRDRREEGGVSQQPSSESEPGNERRKRTSKQSDGVRPDSPNHRSLREESSSDVRRSVGEVEGEV